MKVTAIKRGFHGGTLKAPGEQFECTNEEFSDNWMAKGEVELPEPEEQGEIEGSSDVVYPSMEMPVIEAQKKKRKKKAKENKSD